LHLAHPHTFESIVSPDHKRLIVKRFANVAGDEEDVDRRLLVARAALSAQYGNGFAWYLDPLVHRWLKGKAWKVFLAWLQRFRATPDFDETERTFKIDLAQRVKEARDLVLADDDASFESLRRAFTGDLTPFQTHGRFLRWLEDDRVAGHRALRSLWEGENSPIERLGSFLERVPTTGLGPIGERLNIGSFLLMAEDPTSLPPMTITALRKAWNLTSWGVDGDDLHPAQVYERGLVLLDELVRDSAEWPVPLRDRLDAQGALWELVKYKERPDEWPTEVWADFVAWRNTAPSEVDEFDPYPPTDGEQPEPTPLPLVDHIAAAANDLHINRAVLDEIVELLEDKRQVVLYGPPGTGKTFLALRLAKAIVEDDPTRFAIVQFHPATSYEDFFEGLRPMLTEAGQVTYERRDGPLVAIANEAALHPDRRYVLVIDEINRANLPKVFGELLFLLEYRTESARTLYRPTEPFKLPSNLWFIGTMNTADRSVALIDAAMRRRFHFVPFFPHEGPMKGLLRRWLEDGGGRLGVAAFLEAVNRGLLGLLGEHLLIGPSHFMKTDLSDRALERIWTYNVFPLIEEQLWGNREEIDRWRWAAVRQRFDEALSGSVASSPADEHRRDDDADAVAPV
jgi:5-methylcytosine-specific restriction protein B